MTKSLITSITLACLSFSVLSKAAENISGELHIENGRYFLKTLDSNTIYNLRAGSIAADLILHKLGEHDHVSGSGDLVGENDFVLQSVDFVTLFNLIGTWTSGKSRLHFIDFYSARFFAVPDPASDRMRSEFNYSITPSNSASWTVFFSSNARVIAASLSLHDNQLQLDFYDSNTGQITQTMTLERLDAPRPGYLPLFYKK